jgi:1,4-dihydroxy-2-naphthoate octaprenyltransferase
VREETGEIVEQEQRVSVGDWIAAARLRSLVIAVLPVVAAASVIWFCNYWGRNFDGVVGLCGDIDPQLPGAQQANEYCYAMQNSERIFFLVKALLCLVVAVFIQMAANYANDYSEGKRDLRLSEKSDATTDPAFKRFKHLASTGKTELRTVLVASAICGVVAVAAGVALAVMNRDVVVIIIGAACFAAGWFYVGGKHPYGYAGMGELFVFIFFGVVAVFGTGYAAGLQRPHDVLMGITAVMSGSYPCLLLLVNNIRDIERDSARGKRTLTVMWGRKRALRLQTFFAVIAYCAFLMVMVVFVSYYGHPGLRLYFFVAVWIVLGVMTFGVVRATAKARYLRAYNLSCGAIAMAAAVFALAAVFG